ncbi:MAG: hypothetical protein GC179_13785 [Anaerolineaceae bacterium]|nr:hypothetical protein [Anaerolineaceae bacterium]
MKVYPNKKPVHEYGIVNPSALFKQALADDSNRIGDWLWYAEELKNESERLYCFERILYINPLERRALKAVRTINARKSAHSVQIRHSLPFVHLFRGAGA